MDDPLDKMVADAAARAMAGRSARAERERAEREQRVARDQQVAELLLTRVRPLLAQLGTALNRRIEGGWHVEWSESATGDAGMKLESAQHPGYVVVEIDRALQATLRWRSHDHDASDAVCAADAVEATLQEALPRWVEQLMQSPQVRFHSSPS
jgi:hypothetical protein